ncbi:hypothetical protein HGRIS_002776 [Hohenbuehelia grisea]|uniref:Uncharacterized protein n=1 Tax=Hohenbuehelia grisea TaxID=104357 RepID=A0ABR3JLG8_9AGAR
MGTRGYKVYRYKGRYIVHYNHFDSYPSGLGLNLLDQIPRDLEAYERWVEGLRKEIEAYEEPEDNDYGPEYAKVHHDQPMNNLFIEWVYEIDLDHEVFHVDSQPIFNLRNMPDEELFLHGISFDKYGHRAYDESLPKEYRSDWKATPPTPNSTSLDVYDLHCAPVALLDVDHLLDLAGNLTPCELSRARVFNALVGEAMRTQTIGHELRGLETAKEVADIPEGLRGLGRDLLEFALGPMIFRDFPCDVPSDPLPKQPPVGDLGRFFAGNPKPAWQVVKPKKGKETSRDVTWVNPGICLHISLHLDTEPNLKAAIGELVQFVKEDTVERDWAGTLSSTG